MVGERRELLEFLHLALEPRVLQRPLGDQQQPVGLERLFDEVVGAALDRGDRGLDVAVAGDHHDRQFGMLLLERIEQLQAVEPAALQPDVEEHEVGPARDHGGQRVVAVARGARAVAFVLQDAGDQLADIGFVVDDEDVGCHDQPHRLAALAPARRRRRRGSAVKRSCIQAPRAPGNLLGRVAQFDAPAVLLENAADDGEAKPGALFARGHIGLEQPGAVLLRQADAVVDHVDDDVVAVALRADRRCGRGRARPGGTAPIASVAFLTMLVSACEISRRSNRAGIGSAGSSTSKSMSGWPTRSRNTTWRTVSATSSSAMTAFGMRAKRENSSTMRLMSSTWRMIVSVHCSKIAGVLDDDFAVFAAQPLGRQLDRRQRVLDLVGDAARDVGPGRGALRENQLGDVVDGDDVAVLGLGRLLAGDAHREIALLAVAGDRDLALDQALIAAARGGKNLGELGRDLVRAGGRAPRFRCARSAARPSG